MATAKVDLKYAARVLRQRFNTPALREVALRGIRNGMRLYAEQHVQRSIDSFPKPPVSVGTYRRSWRVEDTEDGARIYNPLPYAAVIEYGRRKGARQPPTKALVPWVIQKGLVRGGNVQAKARGLAFVIARSIARKGTPPRPVLRRAMKQVYPLVLREIKEEFKRAR